MSAALKQIIESSKLINSIKSDNSGNYELRKTSTGRVFILQVYSSSRGFEIFYPERSNDLNIVLENFNDYNESPAVCLNSQTVRNLKNYLSGFPNDAKVIISDDFKNFDCVIACNFEHQTKNKTVQLIHGFRVND